MAKRTKRKVAVLIGSAVLIISALGLTALRAPGSTVEGYGAELGMDGDAPSRAFAAALKDYPVSVGGRELTAGELGVSANDLPKIPRAWSFEDWSKNHEVKLTVDEAKRDSALASLEGYGAPLDGTVAYSGSWVATPAAPGSVLSQDLPSAISEALHSGKKSLALELQPSEPVISTEAAQATADALNSASIGVFAGSSELATLSGEQLAGLITVSPKDGLFTVAVNGDPVNALAEGYSKTPASTKVDGELVVNEEGESLKTMTAPQDGFTPGSTEEIAKALTASLATVLQTPAGRVDLPGALDPAKPRTLLRTATVDASDHYAYFYENGAEVARFPVAVGRAGSETDRGVFKVYTQLTSQDMGSCDSSGNYEAGGSADYCTADVPWVTYFNSDEGFHGTYWHNNFGNDSANMSHGCVNMRVEDAKWAYEFLQIGTTVTVQD